MTNRQKRSSYILPYSRSCNNLNSIAPDTLLTSSFIITFTHHGKKGTTPITLYTGAASTQAMWIKKITDQKARLARCLFSAVPLVQNALPLSNKVNHTEYYSGGILVGTDQGVYITDHDAETKDTSVTKIMDLEKVAHMEVVPESHHLLVLADKNVWMYPLDRSGQQARLVCSNASLLHVGACLSKKLVCVARSNTLLETTIRVFERVTVVDPKKKTTWLKRKFMRRDGLKAYKDLYFPSEVTSLCLLKAHMCITSPKGIGVVDMKSFGVQALLDPNDEAFEEFGRPDLKPITVFRVDSTKYLVCYNGNLNTHISKSHTKK
jgi:hypothetical protein